MPTKTKATINLVRRIRRYVSQRRTFSMDLRELDQHRINSFEEDTDIADRLAEYARCDWLLNPKGFEVRFFEGN